MPEIEIPVERARIVLRLAVSAEPDGHEEHVEGLLDTGSTQTFISSDLIKRIEAAPIGSVAVNSMEIVRRTRPTYPVHVRVPAPQFSAVLSPVHFRKRIVAVGADGRFDGRHPAAPCDVLLGMDLISRWQVHISDGRCTIEW